MCRSPPPCPPYVTFRWFAVSLRGSRQSPVLPFACCVGWLRFAGCAACVPAGVVFMLAAPSSWRTAVVRIATGVVSRSLLPTALRVLVVPLPRRASPGMWSVGLLFLHGALDSHPFFPSHAAVGRCVLTAAAAHVPAGVVSTLAEPSSWHTVVLLPPSPRVFDR